MAVSGVVIIEGFVIASCLSLQSSWLWSACGILSLFLATSAIDSFSGRLVEEHAWLQHVDSHTCSVWVQLSEPSAHMYTSVIDI